MAADTTLIDREQATTDQSFALGALQIAGGATWFGLGLAIGTVLEYATQGLIAIRLGPEDFGLFNVGLRIIGIVTTLALLALPGAVAYFVPRYRAQGETEQVDQLVRFSVWSSLFSSLLVGAVLFLISRPLAQVLFHELRLTPILRLFALTLPGSALVTVLVGNLRGLKRSREASLLTSIYERVIRLVFIIAFLTLGLGVRAPVLAYLPASIAIAVLGIRCLRRAQITLGLPRLSSSRVRELGHYAWPLMLSQLLGQSITSIPPLLLAHFYDARAVGLYSVAWLIAQLFALVLTASVFLYVPVIAEVMGVGDLPRLRRLYRLVTKWQFIITLPSYLLAVALPHAFLGLFSRQYSEARWALILLATGIFISISFGPVGATLLATGETTAYLLLNVAGTLFGGVAGLLLIPALGLLGAAVASMLTTTVWNVLTWLAVYRRYGMHPFGYHYLVIGLSALGCLLFLYPLFRLATNFTPWALAGVMPLYTVLTLLLLWKLRLLDEDSQMIAGQFLALGQRNAVQVQVRLRQALQHTGSGPSRPTGKEH